ncbi:ClpXP adapter SpxH family protein [Alteribacillus bidgolensis]|uniref:ClpXP adapter protein SpxH n=1 Tax=Alteribacillus bidgolensis TaxID=930129 RepID=A0A1G8J762_9BACI|nr:ClpXP adapter SpxH family protein [Alteribacillus bidgolensis]SDI26941.1 Predicted dithiol-disulfide isomerase, DsbA family [Alteribacillus bidgolensis]
MKEDKQLHCDKQLGICGLSPEEEFTNIKQKKKLELYIFTDPLCPECWAFEPTLKKLVLEYGHYFSMRFFVAADLDSWNKTEARQVKEQKNLADLYEATANRTGMSCDGDIWLENPIKSAYAPSIAMKAAEMQGRQLASVFFRRLREMLFLHKRNIADEKILIECARKVGLDMEEFQKDIHSHCAVKALQCDMKTTKEMEVERAPTFVFFNDRVEDGGLKVSGLYPYEVYVDILKEMLGEIPMPSRKMTLEEFLKRYEFVATKEVAVVFDWNERDANAQLKKLVLQRKIERVPVKYGTFWRYIGE